MEFYRQNVIAIIWDFDQTLIPGHMEDGLLKELGVNAPDFWKEVEGLSEAYLERGITVSQGSAYLNHMLTYVKDGKFGGLSNERLKQAGAGLRFYEGVPEIFDRLSAVVTSDPKFQKHDVVVEHYIVSAGLKRIIDGSVVRDRMTDVWACEFIDVPILPGGQTPLPDNDAPITQVEYVIDETSKTRAVFEINKGTNDNPDININGSMPPSERRVPFENMICVADGPSDVPMFSVVNQFGGKSFAVYNPSSEKHFKQVALLQEQGRVLAMFPADYRKGRPASLWLERAVRQAAKSIGTQRERLLESLVSESPSHVTEAPGTTRDGAHPTAEGDAEDDLQPSPYPASARSSAPS